MRRLRPNWFPLAVRYGPLSGDTITHNGTHRMVGRTEHDVPVWPLAEWLARHPVSRRMVSKLQALNPMGQPEGMHPRGYHPKLTVRDVEMRSDCQSLMHFAGWFHVSPRDVERIARARGLKLIKLGRRKFVPGLVMMELELATTKEVRDAAR